MDTQALEQFKVRLSQTIFWCASRAANASPATALRTSELRPCLLEENRSSAVNTVVHARELFGGVDIRKAKIPAALGYGRLLVYFPNDDLACGAAEHETAGFFDVNNVPPWDTWVDFLEDEQPNVDSFDTEYLVAWVPPELVSLADQGIAVNPEQCILWLSDTSVELVKALRTENLLE
jgi:hypothetical protein